MFFAQYMFYFFALRLNQKYDQLHNYTIHFADGSVQDFPVNASENKLVADYHYANPLQSASTRLAWTDPIRGRGVYVMQLDLAETREVTGFEIGNPSKMGLHMLLAISCI